MTEQRKHNQTCIKEKSIDFTYILYMMLDVIMNDTPFLRIFFHSIVQPLILFDSEYFYFFFLLFYFHFKPFIHHNIMIRMEWSRIHSRYNYIEGLTSTKGSLFYCLF